MRKGTGDYLSGRNDNSSCEKNNQKEQDSIVERLKYFIIPVSVAISGLLILGAVNVIDYFSRKSQEKIPELMIENKIYQLKKTEVKKTFDAFEDSLDNAQDYLRDARNFYLDSLDKIHESNVEKILNQYK